MYTLSCVNGSGSLVARRSQTNFLPRSFADNKLQPKYEEYSSCKAVSRSQVKDL